MRASGAETASELARIRLADQAWRRPALPAWLAGQQAIGDFSRRTAQGGTYRHWPHIRGPSIRVFRIRAGQIVLFRDYCNPRGPDELLIG